MKKLLEEGPDLCEATFWENTEKGHGRIETRICTTLSANDLSSRSEWIGLKTIARISPERKEGEKIHQETVYYIGSINQEADLVFCIARGHWKVENFLHWRMHVVFGQDKSRYRD